jgi:uncharacterized protein (TIGR03086 family)
MTGGTALLDQAICYALGTVSDVTPALYSRRTPCRGWNLEMLLRHLCESLTTLHGGIVTGHAALIPESPALGAAADPALAFPDRAAQLIAARAAAAGRRDVDIAGRRLPVSIVECTGALEVAIHGWDVSQACGRRRPIPDVLATALLAVAPLLIPEVGRHPLFDEPVTTAAQADLGDRLVAFLGRNP